MYRIPSDFDGRAFVGQLLSSVTFTVNTIQLAFGSELLLTVLSAYSYRLSADGAMRDEQVPAAETALLGLVGRQVVDARVSDGRNFTVELDGGGAFSCIDDSEQYESYSIKIADREIIV